MADRVVISAQVCQRAELTAGGGHVKTTRISLDTAASCIFSRAGSSVFEGLLDRVIISQGPTEAGVNLWWMPSIPAASSGTATVYARFLLMLRRT